MVDSGGIGVAMSENGETWPILGHRLPAMELDLDSCYRAIVARDARFDGIFFVGVSTTGIYCRPICPARTPRKERCDFFRNAASAERAGFRPCLRCRPELAPGLAPVDGPRCVAQMASVRIEAGGLNGQGVEGLAAEFGMGARQLRRVVEAEFGVTPVELAQTRRLLLAKQLLTESALPISEVAFASGFSSLRRFNHLFRTRYALSPGALRRDGQGALDTGRIGLKLSYRPPLAWVPLLRFLGARGALGVEAVVDGRYLRTVRIGAARGWIGVRALADLRSLEVELSPTLLPVLVPLMARLRALFDLDADPLAIARHLARDPLLAPGLLATPGLRVPGAFDGFELCLRTILGQQVTVRAATTLFGRFAAAFGEAIETPHAALTHLSPEAARIAESPLQAIIDLGLTQRRAATVLATAQAVAAGNLCLEPGRFGQSALDRFMEIPGIGPWTANYVAMRALRMPDAFPHGDLALCKVLGNLRPAAALARSEAWRPWRSYAALYLWNSLHKESGG